MHFGNDLYRMVWEVYESEQRVMLLVVGPRFGPTGEIYDQPKPAPDS